MNASLVDKIVQAVLYEGYILYPYRPSVKNRQRWTFGGLYPRAYGEQQRGSDPWRMQIECPISGPSTASVRVTVRFLHLMDRIVGELAGPLAEVPATEPPFRAVVEAMRVGDRTYQAWQEAVERAVELPVFSLAELALEPRTVEAHFPATRDWEPLRDASGAIVGVLVRQQQAVSVRVDVAAGSSGASGWKLSVRICNTTPFDPLSHHGRDAALLRSLASTHAVLWARGGEFASLTDPPAELRDVAVACENIGAWPVMVGEPGERDAVLASPIILYDYPQIAPESPGDLFDATEIDEILTLRILTLSEQEKKDAAAVDPRASALLARTESVARDQLMRLHGTIRGLRPVAAATEEASDG